MILVKVERLSKEMEDDRQYKFLLDKLMRNTKALRKEGTNNWVQVIIRNGKKVSIGKINLRKRN